MNATKTPQDLNLDLHIAIRRLLAEAEKVRALQAELITAAKQSCQVEPKAVRRGK